MFVFVCAVIAVAFCVGLVTGFALGFHAPIDDGQREVDALARRDRMVVR